ncbi:MAG TPA: hypothetical protein VJN70_17220 [Gemmatimonadaceae bacterium]|nr:hypothetical protein [Gemmatimonadaceae bacterium]
MTMRREGFVAVSLALGAIVLPSASSAQTVGVATPPPPAAEQQWASVRCSACQAAGISLEVRQLANEAQHVNGFTVARLRNLTQRGVAGTLDVLEDNVPDSDGHVRWQTLWFVLSPLGNQNGEQLVLLRQSTPVQVIVHDITQW